MGGVKLLWGSGGMHAGKPSGERDEAADGGSGHILLGLISILNFIPRTVGSV